MNAKISLMLLALAVSAGTLAEDQIYKWRDARGVWHFSSNAPEGVGAQRVSVRYSTTLPDPVVKPAAPDDAAKASQAAATAAAGQIIGPQSVNCKAARDAVIVLETSPKVSMDSNGDGVQEVLTAQQQIEELQRRRAQSKIYCAEA